MKLVLFAALVTLFALDSAPAQTIAIARSGTQVAAGSARELHRLRPR